MMTFIFVYLAVAVTILIADALWLGVIARSFYFSQLKPMMRERPRFDIAALFYLFYAWGVVVLAVMHADTYVMAFLKGLMLGFTAYGTYNFTNMATLKDWPYRVSYVDLVWGSLLTATASLAGYFTLSLIS